MSRFFTVKAFKVFLTLFLKVLPLILPLFKGSTILPVYGVGISLFLLLKIAVLSRVFLLFSAKVIV
jgi:hypothetical protein